MSIKALIKKFLRRKPIVQLLPIIQVKTDNELLNDKVVLIIGGTAGIGLSIAHTLLEEGCRVIIARSTQQKLDNALAELNSSLVKGLLFDLANPDSFGERIRVAEFFFGPIDVLVNSAGVHTKNVNFFRMTPNEYDRIMNINLKGAYFLVQVMASLMIEHGRKGKIILINSNRGDEPAFSPYGISKWGGRGMVYGLARELVKHGILLNAIAPGTTATSLIDYKEGDSIKSDENLMGRLIMPCEVANIVKLLINDANNMIVGEIIHVSGGRGLFDIR